MPTRHPYRIAAPMPDSHNTPGDAPAPEDSTEELQIQRETIGRRIAGRRLDKHLSNRFPRISRTVLKRFIKEGLVTVNGMPSKPSYEPGAGDVIEIAMPRPPSSKLIAEDIPLDILYEDDWFLVINKQAGIICHPARATQSGTIANAIAYHATSLSRGSDPFRPGIVHRLDKNTTGVMLIAKTDEAHWRIALQFERRTIRKTYFAICEGRVSRDGDIINKPLAPQSASSVHMITRNVNPPRQAMFKEAITEYRVNKRFRGYTTVDLFPKTGRTHQLRVHMSSIGHPMVGDALYGGHLLRESDLIEHGSSETLMQFQALHARRLKFMHPIQEKPVEFEAPLPKSLERILALLEAHRAP